MRVEDPLPCIPCSVIGADPIRSSYPHAIIAAPGHTQETLDRHDKLQGLTDNAVEKLVVAKRAVTAVMPNNEQRPEHSPLRQPVRGPHERTVDGQGTGGETRDNEHVSREVRQRPERVLLEALVWNCFTNVR